MARGRPGAGKKPLRRRVATLRPRKTFLIICEGERTEPEYLDALKRQRSAREAAAVDIRVETGRGVSTPRQLVDIALAARQRALGEGAEIDEFWCVFDVEWPINHPGLRTAIEKAESNGVRLAVSNPCFELWLILHFRDYTAWLDSHEACRIRRGLDGSPDKGLNAAKYMPNVAAAADRAANLDMRHERDDVTFPHTNPSSGMHLLVAAIESLGDTGHSLGR